MFKISSTRLNSTEKHQIELNGQNITYTIRHSFRARYVRLVIRPATGLTVTIPSSYTVERVPDIIRAKSGWILKKLAEYSQNRPPVYKEELRSGDEVPYLGRYLKLELQTTADNHTFLDRERGTLVINPGPDNQHTIDALRTWYRAQAEEIITEKVGKLSGVVGVTFSKLIIRGQKTIWGSCSRKKTLSFNWKLVTAPESVMEYVIIHELVHLKAMNHGKTFWKLVELHCPQWREHKRWLKEHGFKQLAF
jgi:predicted metal-dependent hydrolase